MEDFFQRDITIRAGPSLAFCFAFQANARPECQVNEAANTEQTPDEAPGCRISIFTMRYNAQHHSSHSVIDEVEHVWKSFKVHRLVGLAARFPCQYTVLV